MTTKINVFRSGEIQNYTPWVLTVKMKKIWLLKAILGNTLVGPLRHHQAWLTLLSLGIAHPRVGSRSGSRSPTQALDPMSVLRLSAPAPVRPQQGRPARPGHGPHLGRPTQRPIAWPQFVPVPRKVTSAGAALEPPAALLLSGAVGRACLPDPVNPMGSPWPQGTASHGSTLTCSTAITFRQRCLHWDWRFTWNTRSFGLTQSELGAWKSQYCVSAVS